MIPVVTYPDVEHLVVDYLKDRLAELGETVTVGVGVPTDWTPASRSHLQVAMDGTPSASYPVIAYATVRLTAWDRGTTEAKRLAALAQGLLLAHPGGTEGIATTRFLTGVLPTRDTTRTGGAQSNAELASTTSRVGVRSVPIEPSGS